MNLYLISQDANNDYDTYSDAVVVAESEEAAKLIHPDGSKTLPTAEDDEWRYRDWVKIPDQVNAKLVGTAAEGLQAGQVICASFHAG